MAAGKKYQEPVYIEEEMNEKYMEGNYDGDADQRYKQERADKRRSVEIGEEIRASQEAVYERETERLSYEYSAVGSEFEKIMRAYIKENEYQQYLVDGAVLRCTQAMTDDVVFTEWGEKVILENKADEVCNIILNVPENPVYEDDDSENAMMINGLRYATVKDTIKNVNIIVPKCNCRLAADRDEEEEKIRNDTDRNKNGVCMHLMRLNEEWDNFEVKDKDGFRIEYAKRVNVAPSPFSAGAGRILDGSEDVIGEKIEGITMTSVLFCKHGGLIMPVTSGQDVLTGEDILNTDTVFALACTLSGKHIGTLSWEQKKMNAEYIYDYLYEKDWTKESICGLLGNVNRESKMNPGVWHDWDNENSAYGIVQWTRGAYLKYYNLSKEDVDRMAVEDPIKLMNNQLDYLIETMKPEYGIWGTGNRQEQYSKYPPSKDTPLLMTGEEYTKSLCAPKDLALVFHASYERSGDREKELQERIDAAEEWYRYFSGEDVCEDDFP